MNSLSENAIIGIVGLHWLGALRPYLRAKAEVLRRKPLRNSCSVPELAMG